MVRSGADIEQLAREKISESGNPNMSKSKGELNRRRISAALSGSFGLIVLDLRQQAFVLCTRNNPNISRRNVQGSFSGADFYTDEALSAGNPCRLAKDNNDVWVKIRPIKTGAGSTSLCLDDAVEEIVCNASERMLLNTKYAELMEKEKPNLFDAIRKWLSGLRDRILKIFEGEGYNKKNAYKEAKILWDVMDEMQEIWDRAMVQAQSSRLDGRQQRESGTDNNGWMHSSNRQEDSNFSHIKEQIDEYNNELNSMNVVASATVPTNLGNFDAVTKWALAELKKTGYAVDRQGYGTIRFGKEQLQDGVRYARTPAEKAAFAVVDKVLKRGIEIGRHGNHKNRQKETVTFAAPVELNGIRGNMAVVVNVRGNNYYCHRIVLPDGSVFTFEEKNTAVRGLGRGVTDNGSLANPTSTADSGKIPQTDADVKSKAKFSLREKKTPTYEELVSKTPVRIVDVRNGIESGTYAEMKGEVLEKAIEEKWFDEPHLNEDTNSLIFLTPKSFSHAFTNLTADFGEDTIRSMAHIPEIIKDAVLVSVNEPKNNLKAENKVYTFFGAINGVKGIEPVKLTVKEFDYESSNRLPRNIREYFEKKGRAESYNSLYDARALEVINVESIKEEPDASVRGNEQSSMAQDTSDSSEIKVADLLELVKGDAEKYIPERGEGFKGSSREMRDTAEEAKGREESAAALRRENRILRERIEYWKKQSRVTKEYTLRNTDTLEYARELVKRLDSAATSAEVNQGLQEMGAYLLNAENVDWDMLWEHALTLAHSMTDDVDIVISDEMKAEREDFESFLKSVPVDVAPLVKAGGISYSDLKGYPIVHRKNGTTVDDLYQQLQERYGEGIFPDVPDGGDMIDNIKRYADAEVLTKKIHKVIIDEAIFYLDVLLPDKMSILPGSAPSGKSAAISAEGVFS